MGVGVTQHVVVDAVTDLVGQQHRAGFGAAGVAQFAQSVLFQPQRGGSADRRVIGHGIGEGEHAQRLSSDKGQQTVVISTVIKEVAQSFRELRTDYREGLTRIVVLVLCLVKGGCRRCWLTKWSRHDASPRGSESARPARVARPAWGATRPAWVAPPDGDRPAEGDTVSRSISAVQGPAPVRRSRRRTVVPRPRPSPRPPAPRSGWRAPPPRTGRNRGWRCARRWRHGCRR